MIYNPTSQQFKNLREELYNILIYDLGVENCIWKLITMLELITEKQLLVVYATIDFLQYYTNNYRPIYHLEKYIYKLTQIVNE
jgi:hypothetical protein